MEIIRTISRLITGIVFIFSGFVKAIDPLGLTYKLTDYFNAFGLEFLSPLALALAILLSSTELVLGVSLLYGYRMKIAAWAVLIIMSFFTILTLFIALTDPVKDCGCFGDALILTNWQTFIKNIILFVFVAVIFIDRNKYREIRGAVMEWIILVIVFIGTITLSFYSYNHLPPLDFRPFSKGSNIIEGMKIPEGAPEDVYETKLIYRNKSTGENKTFDIESIPDSTAWEFISSESKLISKGYEPPIHDFTIVAPNGQEITEQVLQNPDYTFLLVSYNLKMANAEGLKEANNYFQIAQSLYGVDFYAITASISDEVFKIKDTLKLAYDFSNVDEIVLKTMIRSNPGLILLKNGTVIGNWHYNDFPQPEDLGPEFTSLLRTYPLSPGVNLDSLQVPPLGSRPDTYRTYMTYLNIFDGRPDTFPVHMIPPERNWRFVSTNSVLIKKGFELPLSDFKILTGDSVDITENILISPVDVFLIITKDPQIIQQELMDRIIRLSTTDINKPSVFYGLTGLDSNQLKKISESVISPITFCSAPASFIEKVSGDGIALVWIQKLKVAGVWLDEEIPEPGNFIQVVSNPANPPVFETRILSYIFKTARLLDEKQTVYLFIIGFFVFSLIIRIFFEETFSKR